MKVMTVFGTRPEAIKMAPVILELKKRQIENIVVVTAQHRELLDKVLSFFKIKQDYDLDLMSNNQRIESIISKILLNLPEIFAKEKPDIVLVHGDTATTLATSLSCYFHKIKLGHVEAGLRTNNKYSPFPEELNRKLTGSIADYHYSPTEGSMKNLLKEQVSSSNIIQCGNTIIDAFNYASEIINSDTELTNRLRTKYNFFSDRPLILVTAHRRENYGDGIKNICYSLNKISSNFDIDIVFPVHPNPNIKEIVHANLSNKKNIHLCEPLDYIDFVYLLNQSKAIITDSGGIQEESTGLNKIVMLLRENTERPESVEYGNVILTGTDPDKLYKEFSKQIQTNFRFESKLNNPYGDGMASKKIVNHIENNLK